jgi:hypothetical protein
LWLCMPTDMILAVAIYANRRDNLVAVSANRHDSRGCFRRQTRHHVAVSANRHDPRGCSANRRDHHVACLPKDMILVAVFWQHIWSSFGSF